MSSTCDFPKLPVQSTHSSWCAVPGVSSLVSVVSLSPRTSWNVTEKVGRRVAEKRVRVYAWWQAVPSPQRGWNTASPCVASPVTSNLNTRPWFSFKHPGPQKATPEAWALVSAAVRCSSRERDITTLNTEIHQNVSAPSSSLLWMLQVAS